MSYLGLSPHQKKTKREEVKQRQQSRAEEAAARGGETAERRVGCPLACKLLPGCYSIAVDEAKSEVGLPGERIVACVKGQYLTLWPVWRASSRVWPCVWR